MDANLANYNQEVVVKATPSVFHSDNSSGGSQKNFRDLADIHEVDDFDENFGYANSFGMLQQVVLDRMSSKMKIFCNFNGTFKIVIVPRGASTWKFIEEKFVSLHVEKVSGKHGDLFYEIESPLDLRDGESVFIN